MATHAPARLRATPKPIHFGRDQTGWPSIAFFSIHKIVRRNTIVLHRLPCWEVGIVERGHFQLLIGHVKVALRGGQLAVIPADVPLQSAGGMNAGVVYWVGLDLGAKAPPGLRAQMREFTEAVRNRAQQCIPASPELLEACRLYLHALAKEAQPLLRAGAALGVAGRLFEALTQPSLTEEAHVREVAPALRIMDAGLSSLLSTEDLANACGMSLTRFNRTFRLATGFSPGDHIRRKRVQAGCRLLRSGDDAVAAIARQVGYGSAAYFATVFRKVMGCSPGEYRARVGS